ncbi:hypothetical protein EV561_102656 [Rhizobium sp. BK376]|jgi:F0F1-type ATP synthase epsilon subunit|nr:hypothetical protein EV561_102656 [Rhizobium sp. BK376]
MSLQPIHHGLTRAVALGILIILPAVVLVSCSTASRQSTAAASKSTETDKEKAAARQRWADRVQRDNSLDSSGSQPGYYGSSFGPRITW